MQDKSYVIAIIVVLGICCLGLYVAVSGYLNSNPPPLVVMTPGIQATSVVIAIPTATAEAIKPVATPANLATLAPVPSPIGAFQTITAETTPLVPTLPPNLPTLAPKPVASATTAAGSVSCAGFQYCPKPGLPDYELGPTGNPCPPNYIWGRVVDATGRGVPNMRIRYKLPTGEISDTFSKNSPDPLGKYDIPAQGGTFTLWLLDSAGTLSPQIAVTAQPFSGAGNCPTRMDFVQQK